MQSPAIIYRPMSIAKTVTARQGGVHQHCECDDPPEYEHIFSDEADTDADPHGGENE